MLVRNFEIWKGWSRYTRRQRLQTLISIIGLSVGMVCFALSALWLRYIESFENFVPDAERVYLLGLKQSTYSQGLSIYNSSGVARDYMLTNFPEVECATRFESSNLFNPTGLASAKNPQNVVEIEYAKIDSMTLRIFGIGVINGRAGEIRDREIVLTKAIANKLFGTIDCIGETVLMKSTQTNDELVNEFFVVAVVNDWPLNSQFRFDVMIGSEIDENEKYGQWFTTIVKLHQGADTADVYRRIEKSYDTEDGSMSFVFSKELIPITSLRSEYPNKPLVLTRDYVRIFMFLGLLVIICALINYMITAVTNMRNRSRTMSLYRLLGASRSVIIMYNIFDWFALFLISAMVGFVLVCILLPTFKIYAGIEIPNSKIFTDVAIYISVILLSGMILSAGTTAFVMSKHRRSVLHGHQSHSSSTTLDMISNTLQLTLCMLVTICAFTIMAQIYYLKKTDVLGFSRENIVIFYTVTPEMAQRVASSALVDDILYQPRCLFPKLFIMNFYCWDNKDDMDTTPNAVLEEIEIDKPFLDFWEMSLVDGRLPMANCKEVAVSESTVNLFGWKDPLNSYLYKLNGDQYAVVGVIKDIYLAPPTMKVTAYVFTNYEDTNVTSYDERKVLSVKAKPGKKDQLIAVTTKWVEEEDSIYSASGGDPLDQGQKVSSFPDDVEAEYDMMLANEEKLVNLLFAVAISSMLVSLIGIYSTLTLTLHKRRKEIALRKIHGAKPRLIVWAFLRSNFISLAIAAAISVPISYIVMTRWLEAYQKNISFPWWLAIGVFVLLLIMITLPVIHKVRAASRENPADVIKE